MDPQAAPATSWSTQQLTEFLALVSSFDGEAAAVRRGVERAAEALDAEAGAAVFDERIVASVGFATGEVDEAGILAAAFDRARTLEVPGVGRCVTIAVPLGDRPGAWLMLARSGEEPFTREEDHLLRGMARVLALALRMLRGMAQERSLRATSERQAADNAKLLASLRERQTLLERLSRIQRSIVHRAQLQDVLDTIVAGARDLLGDQMVVMRLVDPHDPAKTDLVASTGLAPEVVESARRAAVGEGAAGRAISEGRLVKIEGYSGSTGAMPQFAASGLEAAMAAPVLENGKVVGSLAVASDQPGRTYSATEQEVLLAFAEHASLALTDAHNFDDALHQAFHDALTELPNRALFLDRLEQATARCERGNTSVAVLFLDLDSFKRVNDSLGHSAGDELLVAVAERLQDCIRLGDTAARFGGDEFAILVEGGEGTPNAVGVASRILLSLQAPFVIGGKEVEISASIGISVGGDESDDLLRNADLAMYRAKGRGKGRYELFEPQMHAAVIERLELEVDMRRAIEREQFELHYQPIVSLASERIVGIEALVRWRHPRRGLVQPDEFIQLAEETRLIVPIGRWVLREACRRAVEWRGEGSDLSVCVNLSAEQLQHAGIVDEVAEALALSGLDARSLVLEITETVLMQDTEATIEKLEEIKRLGVRLAVDDFGTGYSSLQYLKRFPIDILKIAKSFVDGLGSARDDAALARAIVDVANSFQMQVVAEGIEHAPQAARLLELGCPLGQGFHFARPMEAAAIAECLSAPGAVEAWPAAPIAAPAPAVSKR